MKFLRKIWLSLGRPVRSLVRSAVRDVVREEVQTVISKNLPPVVIGPKVGVSRVSPEVIAAAKEWASRL